MKKILDFSGLCAIIESRKGIPRKTKGDTKMTYTAIELKVLEMIAAGAPLHGMAREIAVEMAMDGRLLA